jgi:hypothetical protein
VLTCFRLKQVLVQTAGTGVGAEVAAAFLASPEQARLAIQLAARLHRGGGGGGGGGGAPAQHDGMRRAGGGPLAQRLARLAKLAARGVLSEAEAGEWRLAVLVADDDPTPRLAAVADLADGGAITPAELGQLKAKLLAHAAGGGRR